MLETSVIIGLEHSSKRERTQAKTVGGNYTLEPNPDAGENKNAPPEKLALAFSTADVVILGWRLGRLADLLRENNLATVHVLSKRYADLDRARPFVASITITPVSKSPA